jgi:glycine/D-amino acid oxidase-like deaminating enzyme
VLNAIDARLIEQVKRKQVRIAVIGMGHVGLPTALGFASMGWTVLGAAAAIGAAGTGIWVARR